MTYFVSYMGKDGKVKNMEVPLNGKVTGIATIRDIELYIQKMEKIENPWIIWWSAFETFPEKAAEPVPQNTDSNQ